MGMAESRAAEGLGDGPAPRRRQLLCSNAGMESERAECQWFLLSQLLEITLHITGLACPELHPGA